MSKRKPKPTHIYRRETEVEKGGNHTVQSFAEPSWFTGVPQLNMSGRAIRDRDREQQRRFRGEGSKIRYWIGEITWKPVFQSEEAA